MRLSLLIALAAVAAVPARAQTPDSTARAVAATAERFFQAMADGDTTTLAAVLHPDAVLVAIGPDGRARVDAGSIGAWVRDVARSQEPWRERFLETPHVEVHGPLATVWGRYDFHVGEQFSHCGTDAFQFVRDGGAWRLLVVTFSVEMDGCAPTEAP